MLSYRHAFHAGNHADVLKHFVLSQVLQYFNQKDKPYWFVDTHAGAGLYALASEFSQKNAEFKDGIARLINHQELPDCLKDFIKIILDFNKNDALAFYPGSPKIAEHCCREQDKLRLFELHPSDFNLLAANFAGKEKQTKVMQQDGFQGIKACLPPPTKRAVILIDPPYELKEDYEKVVTSIQECLKRFATGTYLIWYPLLQRPEPELMVDKLKKISKIDWLDTRILVERPPTNGYGMVGSGMFIINPPWKLPEILNQSIPILTRILAVDESAHYNVISQIV
jgi:23S rRNA (adenine2030-N6)-methyltransferase